MRHARPQNQTGRAPIRVLALLALLAAGFWGWTRFAPPEVLVASPTRGPAVRAVYATGTVEPAVMLPIAPRVAGRLTELRVDEGARVARDEVLARLEDLDLERTVEELEARAKFAKENFDRARVLFQRGLGPQVDRDRAQSELEAAEAAAARARAQREFMWLRAPAAGQILRRDGEVGQLIPVNQPVFYMACCAGLRVSAQVDEEDIVLVQPGQRVLIRADAFPDRSFEGSVTEITPMGDPVTRTYRVRIGLADETALRIGMTTDANVVVEEHRDALLLPATAVADGAVWTVRDGRLRHTPLRTGIAGANRVEVLDGLDESAVVVTVALPGFRDGMRVRTRPAAADAH